jgi:hypothetical protein
MLIARARSWELQGVSEQKPRKRRPSGADPTLQLAPMTTLYRPVGATELAQIVASGYRRFPANDDFHPVRDEARARALADAGVEDGGAWVVRFAVQTDFLSRYPKVDDAHRIPASDLPAFNDAIVGPIVVLRTPTDPAK